MYNWCKAAGLNPVADAAATEALPVLVSLVTRLGSEVVRAALDEAVFRVDELPTRTPEFQRRYLELADGPTGT